MGPDFTFQNYQEDYLKCEFMSTFIKKEFHPKCILCPGILVCDISNVWYMFYQVCNLFVPQYMDIIQKYIQTLFIYLLIFKIFK